PGGDAVLDAFDLREVRSQPIDGGRRQRRHRARTADHQHVVTSCCSVERLNAAYVSARVCEIHIVSSRFNTGARYEIVLSLKRPGRVNDDARSEPPQFCSKLRRATIEHR